MKEIQKLKKNQLVQLIKELAQKDSDNREIIESFCCTELNQEKDFSKLMSEAKKKIDKALTAEAGFWDSCSPYTYDLEQIDKVLRSFYKLHKESPAFCLELYLYVLQKADELNHDQYLNDEELDECIIEWHEEACRLAVSFPPSELEKVQNAVASLKALTEKASEIGHYYHESLEENIFSLEKKVQSLAFLRGLIND